MFSVTKRFVLTALGAAVLSLGALDAHAQTSPARFTVEVRGQGDDVILIPGLGSSRDVWAAEADALAATHRLHLVQLNGFAGHTAPASHEAILAPTVEELNTYIASSHLDHPAIIGHSMGGLMGLMLARAHPESAGRLMVVDSLPFFGALFGPNATPAAVAPQAAAMRGQIAAMSDADFAAQQNGGIARLVRTLAQRQRVSDWCVASDRPFFAQAMYEVMTTDMRGEVPNVATPITVLYAYAPEMGPQAAIDGLYQSAYAPAPHARLVRIDDAFHFVMLDQPAAFSAAVAEFLR